MEYQTGAYFVMLYFLTLLFPFTVFQVNILIMVSLPMWTLLKCHNAYCTLQVANSTVANCQFQLHLTKFTTSHCQITIFTSPLLHCKLDKFTLSYGLPTIFGLPKKNPLAAQFSKKVSFDQTLLFWTVFFWGGWGACIGGLPSYFLAYILINLHTHLLRLPIHLPTI